MRIGLSLQTVHNGQAHALSQVRVFAVGLLTASPTGVAEDVDVRRPERQTLVALHVTRLLCLLVFGAGFVADGREHLVKQFVVPRCCHLRGDGEHCHEAVAPDTVQCLVPPLEGRNAQPWDSGRHVHHQLGFLLNGQSAQQVFSALLSGELRVLVGQHLCRQSRCAQYQYSC